MSYKCHNCKQEVDTLDVIINERSKGAVRIVIAGYKDNFTHDLTFEPTNQPEYKSIYSCPNCFIIVTTDDARARNLLLGVSNGK